MGSSSYAPEGAEGRAATREDAGKEVGVICVHACVACGRLDGELGEVLLGINRLRGAFAFLQNTPPG